MYCLGDLVNQNVWNNEVVEFIQSGGIPCVLGNHDEGIGNNKAKYPFSYGSREEVEWGLEAIAYTLQEVTEENKRVLRSFPLKRCLDLETGSGSCRIVLAHGSPSSNTLRLYQFYEDAQLMQMADSENARVLLVGNTHRATHRIIGKTLGTETVYYHIINPGSVGYPKDGSWHACYALVTIDAQRDLLHDPDALEVKFFRLDYDINIVIRSIKKSPLSLYYAGRLLKY
jgi:diadenosine tetraphosphatase ApaH/serine/threonine PP2A family protein phosphatase